MTRSEALSYRSKIEAAASTMTDENALGSVELFAQWQAGRQCAVGDRLRYNGTLYRCVQAHTTQADWTPDITPALWAAVGADE